MYLHTKNSILWLLTTCRVRLHWFTPSCPLIRIFNASSTPAHSAVMRQRITRFRSGRDGSHSGEHPHVPCHVRWKTESSGDRLHRTRVNITATSSIVHTYSLLCYSTTIRCGPYIIFNAWQTWIIKWDWHASSYKVTAVAFTWKHKLQLDYC